MDEQAKKEQLLDRLDTPYFTFVWAEDEQGLIGSKGELPWHLPNEMKHFVEVTTGDIVVMGRKTYESIPNPPLKNRVNIVLSRNPEFEAEDAIICRSKEEIMEQVAERNKAVHIIGGTSLFEMFADEVDMLYRTIVYGDFSGDTYMPAIDYRYFRIVDSWEGTVDANNKHPHQFFTYVRKKAGRPS